MKRELPASSRRPALAISPLPAGRGTPRFCLTDSVVNRRCLRLQPACATNAASRQCVWFDQENACVQRFPGSVAAFFTLNAASRSSPSCCGVQCSACEAGSRGRPDGDRMRPTEPCRPHLRLQMLRGCKAGETRLAPTGPTQPPSPVASPSRPIWLDCACNGTAKLPITCRSLREQAHFAAKDIAA